MENAFIWGEGGAWGGRVLLIDVRKEGDSFTLASRSAGKAALVTYRIIVVVVLPSWPLI